MPRYREVATTVSTIPRREIHPPAAPGYCLGSSIYPSAPPLAEWSGADTRT